LELRDEITEGKMHNEEFHNLYSSPDISVIITKENEMGAMILVGKSERKFPLGISGHSLESNNKKTSS
jgi:hypothetical protein